MAHRSKKKIPGDLHESRSFHGSSKYKDDEDDKMPPLSIIENHDDWIGTLTEHPNKNKKTENNKHDELDFHSQNGNTLPKQNV